MDRAGFYSRAGALLIDILIVAAVVHVGLLVDVLADDSGQFRMFGVITGLAAVGVGVALAAMELSPRGTPGKRFMRLIVLAADATPAPRLALLRRTLVKHAPFALAPFPIYLFSITGPYGLPMAIYVRDGLFAVAVIDSVIAGTCLLVVMAGCIRALAADRRALHDFASGTAVFHLHAPNAARGFAPLLPTE